MALDVAQWTCIECHNKDELFKSYRTGLESRIRNYKRKFLRSDKLTEKYRDKEVECYTFYQHLKKTEHQLAFERWRRESAVLATFPVQAALKTARDEAESSQSQLVSEREARLATDQFNVQLQSQTSVLQEKNSQLEKELQEYKGNVRSLQRQLRNMNHANLKQKKELERLKVVSKGVQGKANKSRQDLGPDVSEDEGISSMDRTSICSSIDSPSNFVADVSSDAAVCDSSETLPQGRLDVCSKGKSKQVTKEIEISKTDNLLKDSSHLSLLITDLGISDENEKPRKSKQNGTKRSKSWLVHSSAGTEQEKNENKTSESELVHYKYQTNKTLPLLDPSHEESHSSAVVEPPLKAAISAQQIYPDVCSKDKSKQLYVTKKTETSKTDNLLKESSHLSLLITDMGISDEGPKKSKQNDAKRNKSWLVHSNVETEREKNEDKTSESDLVHHKYQTNKTLPLLDPSPEESHSSAVGEQPLKAAISAQQTYPDVCSKEKSKQLYVTKETETSKADSVLKDSSLLNLLITDLDISSDEDERPKKSKQNRAKQNKSWSVHSSVGTEQEKNEKKTCKSDLAHYKYQTNKILPLLDPSPEKSHSSAVGEHPVKAAISAQRTYPDVCSKDKSKQLHVVKETRTSKTDTELKGSSLLNLLITDLDISSDEDERPKKSKQNDAKQNNSLSVHSNLEIEGEKNESKSVLVRHKYQTNKILPLLDPSSKQSLSSAVGELTLHTEQQKSLPLTTIGSTESEDHELLPLHSTIENQNNASSNGLQFQNQTDCYIAISSLNLTGKQHKSKSNFEKADIQRMDFMEHENVFQIDHDTYAKEHDYCLKESSLLLAEDTNKLTLEENEVVPLNGMSNPECKNLSQSNATLKTASEAQKQNTPKHKIRSIFDPVEVQDCAPIQTKLKCYPSRRETLSKTDVAVPEKVKKQQHLLLVEHAMDDTSRLSTDEVTEDVIDNMLQGITARISIIPPFSPTSVQDKEEQINCSVAVGTEHLLLDVGVGTEHSLSDVGVGTEHSLSDVGVGTEHSLSDVGVQTDQGLHNKKKLIPVGVQTELHDMDPLRARHTSLCSIDNPITVHNSKNNTLETCPSQQPQRPEHLEDGAKERCDMCNKDSEKHCLEYKKILKRKQQKMDFLYNCMSQMFNLTIMYMKGLPSLLNDDIDYEFTECSKTSEQFGSKDADHLGPMQNVLLDLYRMNCMAMNGLLTSGDSLCCNKNLVDKECSTIDVDSNNSTIKSGSLVELKHVHTDKAVEELIYRDNSPRSDAHDTEKNTNVLKKREPDSDILFGSISDLSSDNEKSSCNASTNDSTLQKRAVEYDSDVVEHSLPVKKMRKWASKRLRVSSSDEDDFRAATNIENIISPFKASAHDCKTPTDTEKNKLPVKITLPCGTNDEYKEEHFTGTPLPSKTVLNVAQTMKKSSKISKKNNQISKLERMRLKMVKERTRIKIPRASPERMHQRLKKKSDVDVPVSSLAKRPKEVKEPHLSQSYPHSLPPVVEATQSKTSRLLPSHITDHESAQSLQVRPGWNTVASAKLSAKSSFQKFETNTEDNTSYSSLAQPSTNTHIIIPLNSQRVSMKYPADSVCQTKPKQGEELANCRSSFNTQSKTVDSLSNRVLSPPLAGATSLQKVNEDKPGDSADKTEQQSHESISNVQKAEKDNETLPEGTVIQWALSLLQKEAQSEEEKKVNVKECSTILQRVRKALRKLELVPFDNQDFAFVVRELAAINKACVVDMVARNIVEAVEVDIGMVDNTHTPPAPPLTVLQQHLMALTFTLHYEHQMFKELPEKILLYIEYKTLRLGRAPKMEECLNLACFYSALCRALKDVKRIQLYCLDVLYSLHFKSAPILTTVLSIFPEALPHASKGKDLPLVKCLVFLILTPVQYQRRTNFNMKPLKDLLYQLYGYKPGGLNADQLLSFLLEKLRNEENKEVPIALILLAKRMSHEWTYRTLLCKNLIPLVDEWREGKLQNSAFAEILPVVGYIVRSFPIAESRAFVERVKSTFISIMNKENAPAEVQEGAMMGLLSLSRHNINDMKHTLNNWQPKRKLSNKAMNKLVAFVQFKSKCWWTVPTVKCVRSNST